MRVTSLFVVLLIVLVSTPQGLAQVAQESITSLTDKLRLKPDDNALREQIIKLAGETKPPPSIPEAARRSFVQGNVIFKDAKDAAGQQLAVAAFKDAVKIAPWWGEAYYNLAVAQELVGSFADARDSLGWYIKTKPGEKEERAAQDKIYALEAKEKLSQAAAAKEQARVAQLKADADAKAVREAQAANAINAYRGNFFASRCGANNRAELGCNRDEFSGSNWYKVGDYDGNRYVYQFRFPGDGTVEILPPTNSGWTSMGNWGVYGAVKKIVGEWKDSKWWNEHAVFMESGGAIAWTCHYTDDTRTSFAYPTGNDPNTGFYITCDGDPRVDTNRRTRFMWFFRNK